MLKASEFKNPYNIVFSILAAFAAECSTRVHFSGSVFSTIEENYIEPASFTSAFIYLGFFAIFYCLLVFVEPLFAKQYNRIKPELSNNKKKVLLFWAAVVFVWWLPYFLSFYPGGIYFDTFTSINYATMNVLSNRHPFLYNCIVWFFVHLGYHFGKTLTWSLALMYACQMLLFEAEIVCFAYWMLKRKVNRVLRILSTAYLVFFNLIPMYAVSVWKDTPFAMAILFWTMFIVDVFVESKNGPVSRKTMLGFVVGMFLTSFLRNNGIYVCTFVVILLFCCFFGRQRRMCCVSLLVLVAFFVIQGPVYDRLGVNRNEPVENYGVPLQQVGAVAAYEGDISAEQQEIIENILPNTDIKKVYSPALADSLKWSKSFNAEYFDSHTYDFLKTWLGLLKQNPRIFVNAYLYETLGFWDATEVCGPAYVQNAVCDNIYGIKDRDLLEEWTGISIKEAVDPFKNLISCAVPFWLWLLGAFITMKRYGIRSGFIFSAGLGVWLTVMIATPIAFSMRYVSPLLFCFPFVFIVPHLLKEGEE